VRHQRPTSPALASDQPAAYLTEIMTAPHSPTSSDAPARKTDLNMTHVAAAALAAVTAAVLGSVLGAAGTLIGAAGASVITTVSTTLYQASLERSRDKVRSLAQRSGPVPPAPQPRDRSGHVVTLRWGVMIVGALGAFLAAMVVITGFEWANGETVGGNGQGTTIGRVVTDQSGPRKPATPTVPRSPSAPASEAPTVTTAPTTAPDTATTTPTPGGGTSTEQSPTKTSDRPAPSEVTPTSPPLIPLPGIGG
jgi:hypothetical protein